MPYIPSSPATRDEAASDWAFVLSLIGALLWVVVYVATVRAGFRAHSYGIPVVAICLNVTWEFLFSFVFPPTSKITRAIYLCWLVLDCIVLYQLFCYGAAEQTIPEIQGTFVFVVIGAIVLAFVFHYTFHSFVTDPDGGAAAYLINLIMSILFLFLAFMRRDLHGISFCAAWTKMLGTGLMSLRDLIWQKPPAFMVFLYLVTLAFDVAYLCLIYRLLS
jgi:hypothetical protein